MEHGKRRPHRTTIDGLRAALAGCSIIVLLLTVHTVRATDLPGVYAAALDQPRVNVALRRTPTGAPIAFDLGGGQSSFNIEAFYDTGASGVLLSEQTADFLEVGRLRWPEAGGPLVEFEDVGVAGSDFFNVSESLYVSLANYPGGDGIDDLGQHLTVYNQTFGQLRTQIGPLGLPPDSLLHGVDIVGMPAMAGKVVVMDPRATNESSTSFPGTIKTYVYNPGTPFDPSNIDSDPGIPPVDRRIDLSYASFERFTSVSPVDAPSPTLRNNPFIGPNPVIQLDPNPPADNTPPVSITFGNQSSTGSWLLDTGAGSSFISQAQAANLNVRYVAGTYGTDEPELETFDPANPSAPGESIPDQFVLSFIGVGGQTSRAGFYLDSLLVRTLEGNPANDDDPNHIRYQSAAVAVTDITLEDPATQQTLTLDGIFGMNMLVGTALIDPTIFPPFLDFADGYFDWLVFDEPGGTLGLDLRDIAPVVANQWDRIGSGNWGDANSWLLAEVPDGNDASVILGQSIFGDASVDLQATSRTVQNLRFRHSTESYTVTSSGGGTLILDSAVGPATLRFEFDNESSHEVAAPMQIKSNLEFHGRLPDVQLTLSGSQTWDADRTFTVRTGALRYNLDIDDTVVVGGGNSLIIDGDAKVTLAGAKSPLATGVDFVDVINNSTDGFEVAQGNHAAGFVAGAGITSLFGGTSLSVEGIQQSQLTLLGGSQLTIRGNGTNAGITVLGTLAIAGGTSPSAKFDLTSNAAVIDYTGDSPAATVRAQILSGRGGPGLNRPWNGQGITSSKVAADNSTAPESRSIAYAENAALPLGPFTAFHGQSVDNTSVLLAYTRTGDANLDGIVNNDDVTIVGVNFAPGISKPHWALGDFDYNGFVDNDDVTLLGAFYNPSAPPLIAPAPPASPLAVVPEPASLILAALGCLGIAACAGRVRRACRRT